MSFAPWGEDQGILLCHMPKAAATSTGTAFRTAGVPRAAIVSWRAFEKPQLRENAANKILKNSLIVLKKQGGVWRHLIEFNIVNLFLKWPCIGFGGNA